jgi:hypothetical protein
MKPRFRTLLATLVAAFATVACSAAYQQPEIELDGVRVGSIGLRGGTLYAQLHVNNPNRFDLETRSMRYVVEVQDPSDDGRWIQFAEAILETKDPRRARHSGGGAAEVDAARGDGRAPGGAGRLTDTAGAEVVGTLQQRLDSPHPKFYIGEGKVGELRDLIAQTRRDARHLRRGAVAGAEQEPRGVAEDAVMDRAELILDIFATRARTSEAQMQVELAQLEYMLPRLKRMWTHLSRIRGGIGFRGPGETQLETDRRLISRRIGDLREKLEVVARRAPRSGRARPRSSRRRWSATRTPASRRSCARCPARTSSSRTGCSRRWTRPPASSSWSRA